MEANVNYSAYLGRKSEVQRKNTKYEKYKKQTFGEFYSVCPSEHSLFMASFDTDDTVKHGYDPILGCVSSKEAWCKQYKSKLTSLSKNKGDDQEFLKYIQKKVRKKKYDFNLSVPGIVQKYIDHAQEDPMRLCFDKYNWYYTGGCLQCMQCKEKKLLLTVRGLHRDTMCVTPLKHDQKWYPDVYNSAEIIPFKGKEIFCINGKEFSNAEAVIGARDKHTVALYHLKYDGLSLSECLSTKSHVPVISFDLDSKSKQCCVIDSESMLSVWDISAKKPVVTNLGSESSNHNKWYSLLFSADDSSTIYVTDRGSLSQYDTRTPKDKQLLLLLEYIKDVSNNEEISLAFASHCNSNWMYVATSRRLLMVDMRSPNVAMQKWLHDMTSPPLYSDVIPIGHDKEIVFIGNQPGNVLLAFSAGGVTYPLVEMPLLVDSLISYQSKGLLLEPSIKPRMLHSLVGLTCLKSVENDIKVLTQTVASDIYAQNVFKNSCSDDADCYMNRLVIKSESLHASGTWNMENLYNGLKDDTWQLGDSTSRATKSQEWQKPIQKLASYKDVLSTVIINEWDVEKFEETETVLPSTNENEQDGSNLRVQAWLNSIDANVPQDSLSELASTSTIQ